MLYQGKEYLTAKESADYLGVYRSEFTTLTKKHKIPSYHFERNTFKYFAVEDLDKYKKEQCPLAQFRKYCAMTFEVKQA